MTKFASLVAETFKISEPLALALCKAYEEGDLPYYLCDYVPTIAVELDVIQAWEIFDFLKGIDELAPKKKRVLNAVEKAGKLNDAMRRSIEFNTSSNQLDDMIIPYRPNPRSKAQIALKKGIGELADLIERQEENTTSLEDLARPYVGKDPTLKTVDDVLTTVKDILAERFAYDETVRAMAREFCYDDGFFEVIPKNRKDPRFIQYRDKFPPAHDLAPQDLLSLLHAEDTKEIRFKLGVQIFRITEILRHHFIQNPDSPGFDLLCQTIDDSWNRLLLPIIERDVKARLRADAEKWAIQQIALELDKKIESRKAGGTVMAVGLSEAGVLICAAVNNEGRLLGLSSEKHTAKEGLRVGDRVKQFIARYRPSCYVIDGTARAAEVSDLIAKSFGEAGEPRIIMLTLSPEQSDLVQSEWMKKNYSDLDASMQKVFSLGIIHIVPFNLVSEIGARYFDIHPMQKFVDQDHLSEVIKRKVARWALGQGIKPRDIADSVFRQFPRIPASILSEIRSREVREPLRTKTDLLKVTGMTDVLYRNIAGYLTIAGGINPLDSTIVHPYFYELLNDACRDLGMSLEGIAVNPGALHSFAVDDFALKVYIQKNLIDQLQSGPKPSAQSAIPRGKLRFDDLQEGMVVQGVVTNITPFGVFVNINSMCDGLIHISQLADAYVETPEQVVSLGDRLNVRVLKVDPKKRRISLSLKGMGQRAPKIKPSENQLSTLVDHFSNR